MNIFPSELIIGRKFVKTNVNNIIIYPLHITDIGTNYLLSIIGDNLINIYRYKVPTEIKDIRITTYTYRFIIDELTSHIYCLYDHFFPNKFDINTNTGTDSTTNIISEILTYHNDFNVSLDNIFQTCLNNLNTTKSKEIIIALPHNTPSNIMVEKEIVNQNEFNLYNNSIPFKIISDCSERLRTKHSIVNPIEYHNLKLIPTNNLIYCITCLSGTIYLQSSLQALSAYQINDRIVTDNKHHIKSNACWPVTIDLINVLDQRMVLHNNYQIIDINGNTINTINKQLYINNIPLSIWLHKSLQNQICNNYYRMINNKFLTTLNNNDTEQYKKLLVSDKLNSIYSMDKELVLKNFNKQNLSLSVYCSNNQSIVSNLIQAQLNFIDPDITISNYDDNNNRNNNNNINEDNETNMNLKRNQIQTNESNKKKSRNNITKQYNYDYQSLYLSVFGNYMYTPNEDILNNKSKEELLFTNSTIKICKFAHLLANSAQCARRRFHLFQPKHNESYRSITIENNSNNNLNNNNNDTTTTINDNSIDILKVNKSKKNNSTTNTNKQIQRKKDKIHNYSIDQDEDEININQLYSANKPNIPYHIGSSNSTSKPLKLIQPIYTKSFNKIQLFVSNDQPINYFNMSNLYNQHETNKYKKNNASNNNTTTSIVTTNVNTTTTNINDDNIKDNYSNKNQNNSNCSSNSQLNNTTLDNNNNNNNVINNNSSNNQYNINISNINQSNNYPKKDIKKEISTTTILTNETTDLPDKKLLDYIIYMANIKFNKNFNTNNSSSNKNIDKSEHQNILYNHIENKFDSSSLVAISIFIEELINDKINNLQTNDNINIINNNNNNSIEILDSRTLRLATLAQLNNSPDQELISLNLLQNRLEIIFNQTLEAYQDDIALYHRVHSTINNNQPTIKRKSADMLNNNSYPLYDIKKRKRSIKKKVDFSDFPSYILDKQKEY